MLLLDIQAATTIADYFVICSVTSERQAGAIHQHVVSELKKEGVRSLHQEGTGSSGWVLVDYGSVILHIFLPTVRQYYGLERLWKTANTLVRIM